MSNSIYGKLLYNPRKNNIDTKIVTNEKRFSELVNNPRLQECFPVSENKVVMKLSSDKIELKYPLYAGFFILEKSKAVMYDLFYNVLKKNYGENVSLIYMDTDSFLLEFKNIDVYNEISKGPLKAIMDTSNFPTNHELFNEENKGKLGYLKSETGSIPIRESISLSAKCYSVLLEDERVKNTAKGVNKSEKSKLKHDIYRDIHDGVIKNVSSTCPTIRSYQNKLYTIVVNKHALAKLDRKRYWINREESVGYGHPSIKVIEKPEMKRKNVVKRKISECITPLDVNLTYKRTKNVMNMFTDK